MDASTTLNPRTPFTFRSGSTTPYCAPFGDIIAVETGCQVVVKASLMKASNSSSVSAPADGPASSKTYPFHAFAAKKRRILLTPSRANIMSIGDVSIAGSISGGSNGLEESILSVPPRCDGEFLA